MIATKTPRILMERAAADVARPRDPGPKISTTGVVYLLDPFRAPYRGRMYEIPPLGGKAGIEVVTVQAAIDGFAAGVKGDPVEAWTKWTETLERGRRLIWKNTRPERRYGWVAKLTARLRNPFKQATPLEVGEWLGFLLRSQTIVPQQQQHTGAEVRDRDTSN